MRSNRRSRILGMLRPADDSDAAIDAELALHIELTTRDLVGEGMNPIAAREEAERRFGNPEVVRTACRAVAERRVKSERRVELVNTAWQDLRYAVRALRKRPGFTGVVVLALALGIGGTATIFSVVNGVLLRPLPYSDPGALVTVWERRPLQGRETNPASYPDFVDWKDQSRSLQHMAAYTLGPASLTGGDEPEKVMWAAVSVDFFRVLRVEPLLGRTFVLEETQPGRNDLVLLSHGLWQRRFGGDSSVVGRTITLDGEAIEVVGVMPAGFAYPSQAQMWYPLGLDVNQTSRSNHFLRVVARLAPGIPIDQARAELDDIARRLETEYPDANTGHYTNVIELHEWLVGDVRKALVVLLGTVCFVLLIVCVNVANMQLARSAAREKEVAIRTTLGATRGRIAGQLLWENGLLAAAGGTIGLLLAGAAIEVFAVVPATVVPFASEVHIDAGVLLFAAFITVATAVIFGLAPTLHTSKPNLSAALKEGTGRSTATGGRRLRASLVVAEFALAIVLLVGAGLMVRSFARLTTVDPGFDPANLLTASVNLPTIGYEEEEQRIAFAARALERIRGVPGVERASLTWLLPFSGGDAGRIFQIEGRPLPDPMDEWNAAPRVIDPDYFDAMRIPVLRGRRLDARDDANAPEVLVINAAMARRFWPEENPLGARIRIGGEGSSWRAIVGVVGDVSHRTLAAEKRPEMYFPFAQISVPFLRFVVRATGDPAELAGLVRHQIWQEDPNLPVTEVATMNQLIRRSVGQPRLTATLLGVFAAIALFLAALGIYGVVSYMVSQRAREIGIRIALGASQPDVLYLVVRRGMLPAALGIGLGLAAALALSRIMSSLLFEVSATDFVTYASMTVLLGAVGLAANYLPARRATRVHPMETLRQE